MLVDGRSLKSPQELVLHYYFVKAYRMALALLTLLRK
jgi:hypothetical protein